MFAAVSLRGPDPFRAVFEYDTARRRIGGEGEAGVPRARG